MLIDQGRLNEAELLLQTLIKEPLCQDFAIGELKYIEELKREQQFNNKTYEKITYIFPR